VEYLPVAAAAAGLLEEEAESTRSTAALLATGLLEGEEQRTPRTGRRRGRRRCHFSRRLGVEEGIGFLEETAVPGLYMCHCSLPVGPPNFGPGGETKLSLALLAVSFGQFIGLIADISGSLRLALNGEYLIPSPSQQIYPDILVDIAGYFKPWPQHRLIAAHSHKSEGARRRGGPRRRRRPSPATHGRRRARDRKGRGSKWKLGFGGADRRRRVLISRRSRSTVGC